MKKDLKIAAYYFPNYHIDSHNEAVHGENWTEWELMKAAKPRYKGHKQPKIPLWGYQDEADPKVMSQKIDAARQYGVDCFIFDAYFYNGTNFLNGCLDKSFLKAENTNDIKFALMWANHNWTDVHPASLGVKPKLLFDGNITKETFRRATQEMIEQYFTRENYFRIDGKPYISIYEVNLLMQSLGGADKLKEALAEFRRAAAPIVGEIHINCLIGEISLLPGENMNSNFDFLNQFDFDSMGSYTWLHHCRLNGFPFSRYEKLRDDYIKDLEAVSNKAGKPYFPNVTMGWDASPRVNQNDEFVLSSYPFGPVIEGNTPKNFGKGLEKVADYAMQTLENPLVVINAWNEWTEGSYLEPDTLNKYGYLKEVRRVKDKYSKK